jgi:hypothetical protein
MMIRSVVVSMLPPYPKPTASGQVRNTSMAHSERAHNEAAQRMGFRSCQRASNAASTHASDWPRLTPKRTDQALILVDDRKPPRLNFPANSRPAPVQP